jgi:hypothetical protein
MFGTSFLKANSNDRYKIDSTMSNDDPHQRIDPNRNGKLLQIDAHLRKMFQQSQTDEGGLDVKKAQGAEMFSCEMGYEAVETNVRAGIRAVILCMLAI